MSDDLNLRLQQMIDDEIWEELCSLSGKELDDYLIEIGFSPELLSQSYSKALDWSASSLKRDQFENARRLVHREQNRERPRILMFEISRKNKVLEDIKNRTQKTRDMTIAARNQKISSESDLDSFLEACFRLGIIDTDGNLKG